MWQIIILAICYLVVGFSTANILRLRCGTRVLKELKEEVKALKGADPSQENVVKLECVLSNMKILERFMGIICK